MNSSRYLYLLIIAVLAGIGSCSKKTGEGDFNEGLIEFKISYLQDEVGGYSNSILPQKMEMIFKDNQIKNSISGAMGFFSLVNLTDLDNKQYTTCLKYLDKKFIFRGKSKEEPCCTGNLTGISIEILDETKEICGFLCKKAIARFPDNSMDSFEIYYTEEINLREPNGNSPFSDIPGVMFEFRTSLGNATMHVIAEKVKQIGISDEEFQIPDDYRSVSRTDMEKVLNTIME